MMIFVPSPPPPSKEAIELGKKIAEAVGMLRDQNPAIRPADVRRGLQLAESELRSSMGGGNPAHYALAAAVAVIMVAWAVAYMFV